MTLSIRPIDPVSRPFFGGVASGIDITKPLTKEQAAEIEKGMDEFGVMVFHDQRLTDETQMAFSRNFGELELATNNLRDSKEQRLGAHIADISNLDANNNVLARENRRRLFSLGTRLWHSDSSFKVVPAKYSLLSARIIPDKGGNTEFADMRAAYDTLDEDTRAECEGLVCEHSQLYSRAQIGFGDFTDEERRAFAPVQQRLIRTHPSIGAEVAVSRVARRNHRRVAGPGGARLPARPDRARDATEIRLFAPVEAIRSGGLGQSGDHAPVTAVRRDSGAGHAPHHRGGHALHHGGSGVASGRGHPSSGAVPAIH